MEKGLDTKVIAGFPGIGKSYATTVLNQMGLKALDSDSSKFSWIDKERGIRNPKFPENYIQYIKENIGKVDYIFVSTHKEVRDLLDKAKIKYELIVPSIKDVYSYRRRFQERGNDNKFIQNVMQNWDKWLIDIITGDKSYTVLYDGRYLMDHIRKEYLTHIIAEQERIDSLPRLGVKLLTPTAKMPTQAHVGDLFDIYADEEVTIGPVPTLVSTGLAFDIPDGYQLRIYNRSSNPLKNGLILSNGVGVIDSGYKDEVKGIFNCCPEEFHEYPAGFKLGEINITRSGIRQRYYTINKGDKIMQAELVPVQSFRLVKVDELDKSNDRGGGFGSTGK